MHSSHLFGNRSIGLMDLNWFKCLTAQSETYKLLRTLLIEERSSGL